MCGIAGILSLKGEAVAPELLRPMIVARALTPEQVEYVYTDIAAKRKATRYQHLKPLLVEDVSEIAY